MGDPLLKPIWQREMLPGECRCPAGCPRPPSTHGVQEGDVGLVSLPRRRGQPWCSNPHRAALAGCPARQSMGLLFISCVFSTTCRRCFRSVLRGYPSLRHGGVLGCGSPGQPRPQNHPGLGEGLLQPCPACVKQQQLLIASDVSEHQLASCCMERHRRVAGATTEGCLSPSPLAQRGTGAMALGAMGLGGAQMPPAAGLTAGWFCRWAPRKG